MTNPTQNPPIVCEVTRASGHPIEGSVRAVTGRAKFRVQVLTFTDAAGLLRWIALQGASVAVTPEPYGCTGPDWSLEICDDE